MGPCLTMLDFIWAGMLFYQFLLHIYTHWVRVWSQKKDSPSWMQAGFVLKTAVATAKKGKEQWKDKGSLTGGNPCSTLLLTLGTLESALRTAFGSTGTHLHGAPPGGNCFIPQWLEWHDPCLTALWLCTALQLAENRAGGWKQGTDWLQPPEHTHSYMQTRSVSLLLILTPENWWSPSIPSSLLQCFAGLTLVKLNAHLLHLRATSRAGHRTLSGLTCNPSIYWTLPMARGDTSGVALGGEMMTHPCASFPLRWVVTGAPQRPHRVQTPPKHPCATQGKCGLTAAWKARASK